MTAALKLHNQINLDAVTVSGIFIDEYMPYASGEFVKLYLFLLRTFQKPEEPFSVSTMADRFNLTEKDVTRALTYWEKQGLLRLSFDLDHTLTDICLIPPSKKVQARSELKPAVSPPSPPPSQATVSKEDLEGLLEDESFKELLFIAQTYLKKTFKSSDCDMFGYWYLMFERSYEIIEYLVEYCVEQGHSNLKYLEAVARNWHESGFRTIAEIRDYSTARTKTVYSVMKAFGLQERSPSPKELEYIQKWTITYAFSLELILKACEKTMAAIHTPSFEYTDSILSAWKKSKTTTLEQVANLDLQYQGQQAKKHSGDPKRTAKSSGQFHNFKQRTTDYDQLVANYYGYHK